ncbi:MAG: SGNH/GDSL hydrolase family protein, partial [Thermoflexales bacterium]|nr:SGNH/GDSL hydrolase family protein [Thermoflexales bacterium]
PGAILVLILLTMGIFSQPMPVRAQGATFIATWQNAWLRTAPSVVAPRVAPVIQGATYAVVGRSEDGQWLALAGPDFRAWLPAGFGEVMGSLSSVPVIRTKLPPAPKNTNSASLPEWIVMTARGRQLYQRAVKAGRDPRMFTVAGDSNSAWQRTFGRIAAGIYDFGAHGHLRVVVSRFDPAFARVSLAVRGGAGAADMFDPAKVNAPDCRPEEGMFACELRLSRASIVFIQLGTGDKFAWREFEANLRRMIDYALVNNVLPVLMTKADDMESIQGGASFNYINDVIRKLAAEYQLPLADFYVATRSLPVVPNPELPHRPFTQNGLLDEWGYYFHLSEEGFALKVLANLMVLDAITRGT